MVDLILLASLGLAGTAAATPPAADAAPRVTVLYFWATWCYPCEPAGKQIQRIHDEHESRGVRVVGVAYSATGEEAAWVEAQGYTFPVELDGADLAARHGVTRLPAVVVLDEEGREILRRIGYREENEAELDALLGERAGAAEAVIP
jgi:thiol-disulfide isomerase/thioredoxin